MQSANFCFLQRLSIIFGFCQDFHNFLLPAETCVCRKWLPAKIVAVIVLPAETVGSKQNQTDRLIRKLSCTAVLTGLTGSKRLQTVSAEAKYD